AARRRTCAFTGTRGRNSRAAANPHRLSKSPRIRLSSPRRSRDHDMKFRLMTPGPSPVPEDTLLELAKPVPYHRTPEMRQLLTEVTQDLQYVFQTKNPVLTLTSSGTGGMEAAVVNCVAPGAKVICLS